VLLVVGHRHLKTTVRRPRDGPPLLEDADLSGEIVTLFARPIPLFTEEPRRHRRTAVDELGNNCPGRSMCSLLEFIRLALESQTHERTLLMKGRGLRLSNVCHDQEENQRND
jgi:hypothetical protein